MHDLWNNAEPARRETVRMQALTVHDRIAERMTAEFSTVLQIAAIMRCRNAEHAQDTGYTLGYASVVTVSIV